jgi:GPH family glycoside/pentoside/hexuronide:cation symporter
LPVWTYYSARVGKTRALTTLCLYLTIVYAAIFFLTSYKPFVWALMVLQGFGIAGFIVASSLLADILDHDEFTTGERRGGAFFGFWTFASKFGIGIAPPLVGGVLWWAGYMPNHPQSHFVLVVMRWLYGPVPAFFFLVAAAIFQRFPLTREGHLEIQAELRRRRAASLENPNI